MSAGRAAAAARAAISWPTKPQTGGAGTGANSPTTTSALASVIGGLARGIVVNPYCSLPTGSRCMTYGDLCTVGMMSRFSTFTRGRVSST